MRTLKTLAIVFSLALLLTPTSGKADTWNRLTKVTFSGPVRVANTELPAGTYIFKLMDNQGDRNIVQIFNEDESHLVATVLASPDYRLTPTSATAVKFAETSNGSEAAGNVPASGLPIKEWFYPGDSFGQEFKVVPAKEVAAAQPEPAPVAAAAPEPAPASAEASAPAQEPAAPPAAAPAPQTDQTVPTADQKTADTDTKAQPSELPKTGSQMPLVGLMGVLSLALAVSLRILLKVTA